jgi:hypothetical protein
LRTEKEKTNGPHHFLLSQLHSRYVLVVFVSRFIYQRQKRKRLRKVEALAAEAVVDRLALAINDDLPDSMEVGVTAKTKHTHSIVWL